MRLAETLEGYGVTHVFFVPMVLAHTLAEMEQRTGIRRIMAHTEKAAAYMADGYARACGRPGICMAQTVGAANLAAGLQDPYLACTPLIAITGGPYPETRNRHTYQQVDDAALFRPVTATAAWTRSSLPGLQHSGPAAGTPGPVRTGSGTLADRTRAPARVRPTPAAHPFPPLADPSPWRVLPGAGGLEPIIVAGGGARARVRR
jgi:acetolactate synthase-1/2/3 large subunit